MEFNRCVTSNNYRSAYDRYWGSPALDRSGIDTLFEAMDKKWSAHGYRMPRVIFWNLDARQNNIPALGGKFSYVSGFSMNMIEQILSGKDGYDLMIEKLDTERYACIH
jgi:hypothetical protein